MRIGQVMDLFVPVAAVAEAESLVAFAARYLVTFLVVVLVGFHTMPVFAGLEEVLGSMTAVVYSAGLVGSRVVP